MQTRLQILIQRNGNHFSSSTFDNAGFSEAQVKDVIARVKKDLKSAPNVETGEYTITAIGGTSECDTHDAGDGKWEGKWKTKELSVVRATIGGVVRLQTRGLHSLAERGLEAMVSKASL